MRAWSFALCILALSASAATARDCDPPTTAEMARYESIARQLQASSPPAGPPTPAEAVSRDEVDWALALEARVKAGDRPSAADAARYEDIARRFAASPSNGTSQAPVSEDDTAWAVALQTRVQGGDTATEAELARYDDIYRRSLPSAPPSQAGSSVSQADIAWALALERRVQEACPVR